MATFSNNINYSLSSNNMEYDYILKFVITGDTSVGKSALLFRFSDNVFNESWLPTIGVDFKLRNLNVKNSENVNKLVKLSIWDTAG